MNASETNEAVVLNTDVNGIDTENTTVEIVPLTPASLSHFDPQTQANVLALSTQIDVLDLERIMSYGQIPLITSFEQAGKILQNAQGTTADQEVVKEVIELTKQANDTYDEFNLILKEPSLIQRILLKISTATKEKQDSEVSIRAVTSYKLLEQLSKSCDRWLTMLKDGRTEIFQSALSDKANCDELEQYIVAGRIAEERIVAELEIAKEQYELSGLMVDKERYDRLKDGLDTFRIVLMNLEKSRAAFAISIGQLYLQERANTNIQIAVNTQRANSMALISQQLRNAVLQAKNKIAMEGQKSLTGLNNELMLKISTNSVLTAEESEKLLLSGIYSAESALEAVKTVIAGCESIQNARAERDQKISEELGKLETLLGELQPFVSKMKNIASNTTSNPTSHTPHSSSTSVGLKF